jgi:predicted RNase H-like HicB family nuclease
MMISVREATLGGITHRFREPASSSPATTAQMPSPIKSGTYGRQSRRSSELEAKMRKRATRRDLTPQELAAARAYAMVIEWSAEDDAFVVSVPDLPGLHTHGATREEAAVMGDEAIAVWLIADRGAGLPTPAPCYSAMPAEHQPEVMLTSASGAVQR